MEMPDYAVAVCASGNDQGIWDLARNQFGSATPMTAFATTRARSWAMSPPGAPLSACCPARAKATAILGGPT